MYNNWFLRAAPQSYRNSRADATTRVLEAFEATEYLQQIVPEALISAPHLTGALRMCTAPPLARDRLVGLASVPRSLVERMEEGKLPARIAEPELRQQLASICGVISSLLDADVCPWLTQDGRATTDGFTEDKYRAATVIADRLTGAVADPLIRNAQEERQLSSLTGFLTALGYHEDKPAAQEAVTTMNPGTFCFRHNVPVNQARIPIDLVLQRRCAMPGDFPLLIECKSAGDFANTNKRRKEEATKIRQLREAYGDHTQLLLFLCGYFDAGYLGYEAAEGLDWIWEHRIEDLAQAGV
jgi:hypothetical protein